MPMMKSLTIGEDTFEIVDEQARQGIETLTNDLKNIIVEETDPTVPSWAKEPNKPTYTASEVGALPSTTKIPTKTSELNNDSGFLTSIPSEYVTDSELTAKGYATQTSVTQLSEEIEDLKTNGTGGTSNLETEVVDVPFRIEWDGSDYSSLDVVESYFYKVSDTVLTEEQLAQGGFFAYLYNGASIIQEFTSRVTNTGDYILIQGREGTVRIYLENNSVGASPGIYFYRTSFVQVFFLEATGCKVSKVVKLNEKHLPETDVIPGQYGGLYGSYYSIPNIKVDSTGRVVEVSESIIQEASAKAGGLITSAMYSHISQGNHVNFSKAYFAINSEYSFALSDVKSTYTTLSDEGYIYLPIVYAAYAYLYTDTSKTTKAFVPAPYKVVPSNSSRCTVKVQCPEEYREFNLNDGDTTGEASYIECIVVYEKPFATASAH